MRIKIEGVEVNAAYVAITVTGVEQIETMRMARDLVNRVNGIDGVKFVHHTPTQKADDGKFVITLAFQDTKS